MEKDVRIVARYHYKDGFFVEVSQDSPIAVQRDYWLCKCHSRRKLFMFNSPYKNDSSEENLIITHIFDSIKEFNQSRIQIAN